MKIAITSFLFTLFMILTSCGGGGGAVDIVVSQANIKSMAVNLIATIFPPMIVSDGNN